MIQAAADLAANNHSPTALVALQSLIARANGSFSFAVPAGTFSDPDAGDMVTYDMRLQNGAALPSWLTFDAGTRVLAGLPGTGDIGSLQLTVWGTDSYDASTLIGVSLNVYEPNRQPILAAPVPDQNAPLLAVFTYQVASGAFSDPDTGDVLTYGASLGDGSALPAWLNFNPTTRTLSGTASTPGSIAVRISATDAAGLSANDTFAIEAGGPIVTGTAANDVFATSSTGGTLRGLGGDDSLTGSIGNDYLDGGDGNDTLDAGTGSNYVDGGADVDFLTVGSTTIASTNSTMLGGAGGDTMLARKLASDTTFEGGSGNDTMTGSGYRDYYRFNPGDGQDVIIDTDRSVANGGNDEIVYGAAVAPADISVSRAGNSLVLQHVNGLDQVTVTEWFSMPSGFYYNPYPTASVKFANNTVWTASALNAIALDVHGSANADILTGTFMNDTLRGSGGNDTLSGSYGANVLDGGDGDDFLYADSGHYQTVVPPSYTVVNKWGSNVMLGGAGTDTLYTHPLARDTVMEGGMGNDTLNGSAYNDTYRFNLGDGQDTIIDEATPEVGFTDRLHFGVNIAPSDIAVTRSANNLLLSHMNGTDRITVQNWFASPNQIDVVQFSNGALWDTARVNAAVLTNLSGGSVPETLSGTSNSDNIMALGGNDMLNGQAGHDRLDGGAGNDTMAGGVGDDVYFVDASGDIINENTAEGTDAVYASVSYTLSGNVENLALMGTANLAGTGNAAANLLTGNSGSNSLNGAGGNDTIVGGDGNDVLAGGAGDDALTGGLGDDTADYSASTDAVTVNLSLTTPQSTSLSAGVDSLSSIENVLGSAFNDSLTGDPYANRLVGGNGNDVVSGDAGIDLLEAGDGNDTLDGGSEPDALYGEGNNDVLYGGTGFFTDILIGGAGDDTLDGSASVASAQPRNQGDYDRMNGGAGNDTYYADTPADLTFEALNDGTDSVIADINGAG